MKRLQMIALPAVLLVVAGLGLAGCNGNIGAHDNCQAGILDGEARGYFPGGLGPWATYDSSSVVNSNSITYHCRVISFDGVGYDGFAVFSIVDGDDDWFPGGAGDWDHIGFPSYDGWGRYDLAGEAIECRQHNAGDAYPGPGTKCSGTIWG